MVIRITRSPKAVTAKALEKVENLIVFLPEPDAAQALEALPHGGVLRQRATRAGLKGLTGQPLVTDLPNRAGTRVSVALVAADAPAFALLELARKQVAAHLAHQARQVSVIAPGFEAARQHQVFEATAAAAFAGAAALPSFKSKPPKPPALARLQFHGVASKIDFNRARAEAEGNNLARELTALPPNELTPSRYRRRVAALAREQGWRMSFLDSRALRQRKAGAFLAVARGSAADDAGIVHLRYRPARTRRDALRVALVGKGICYDTGGVNLKPARYMHGMHEDMAGSAVALGTLLTLTRLKAPFPVDCWLALARNEIGPRAYTQNEVVRAANGTTIEVMHTDAEGRMVLADTLALASRNTPDLIIDYATLTGSCIQAIGTRYSGAFTNRPELHAEIIAAGRDCGERVWPFPLDEDFDRELESRIADIKQCSLDAGPDHIHGARFLGRFVADLPWIHIDLSSGSHRGGLGHVPTDTTGFGVRFTTHLLLDRRVPVRATGRRDRGSAPPSRRQRPKRSPAR